MDRFLGKYNAHPIPKSTRTIKEYQPTKVFVSWVVQNEGSRLLSWTAEYSMSCKKLRFPSQNSDLEIEYPMPREKFTSIPKSRYWSSFIRFCLLCIMNITIGQTRADLPVKMSSFFSFCYPLCLLKSNGGISLNERQIDLMSQQLPDIVDLSNVNISGLRRSRA